MPSLSERLAEKERAARAKSATPSESTPLVSTPVETASDAIPVPPPPRIAPAVEITPVESRPASSTPVQSTPLKTKPVPAEPRGEIKSNYTKIPNAVLDGALAHLGPSAQLVYLHLLRLAIGHNRDWCKIGHARLQERTGLGESAATKALRDLERAGLVAVLRVDGANPDRKKRGTEFRLYLPADTPLESTPVKLTPVDSTGVKSTDMKETPRKSYETAAASAAPSIYEVRTIGARLFERHRSDPGFDHERLAELVADALAAQGIAPNGELIEEAIKGMAIT
jgi:hypothetical protein